MALVITTRGNLSFFFGGNGSAVYNFMKTNDNITKKIQTVEAMGHWCYLNKPHRLDA